LHTSNIIAVPVDTNKCAGVDLRRGIVTEKTELALAVFAIAFHGSEIVGYSDLWIPRAEGQSAVIDYTGVLKEHRGKGIAFAVKLAAMLEGMRAGVKRIRTHNDPDNPVILHLNKKMGFRDVPGLVIFKKTL